MLDLVQGDIGRFMRLGMGAMTNTGLYIEVAHDLDVFFKSIQIDDQ